MTRLVAISLTFALVALLAGCATTVPPSDPVYTRISELQNQVDKLQKLVKGQQFMSVVSGQQTMQQKLSSLQGELATLRHQLQQSNQRQQAVNRNFDQRLATLEGGSPEGVPGAVVSGSGASGAATAAGAGQSGGQSGGQSSGQQSDQQAYRAAFDKLRSGLDGAAVGAFKQFIKNYPDSSLVPNAWYWMAETHYVNGKYQDAITAFRKVITKYPNSDKAGDSWLKIGYAQYALGDYDKARSTFKKVIQKFPGTTPADLAKQRLSQMGG